MPEPTLLHPVNIENIAPTAAGPEDFQFLKVEDFFIGYQNWDHISHVESQPQFDQNRKMLILPVVSATGLKSAIVIQVPRKDIYRFRFNPRKADRDQYTAFNTHAVRFKKFDDLIDHLSQETNHRDETGAFDLEYNDQSGNGRVELITKKKGQDQPFMKISITMNPYQLSVFRFKTDGSQYLVHSDAIPSLYYQKHIYGPNNDTEYSVVQAKTKPDTAQYFGFGEKGGDTFYKNSKQLNFFNFDNMRYSKVYGKGPLEDREPLYHSNPFFLEFHGVSSAKSNISGVFVDNYSQVFLDMGAINPNQYLIGTRFNDLDYYTFLGDTASDIIEAYTAIVGRANLPPRYVLGYHQGCYGYDSKEKVMNVAKEYRNAGIPIDGLHIDVDIQKSYHTFTIDERKEKFQDPKEMFDKLRDMGFKCSTNITPIISNEVQDPTEYPTYHSGLEKNCFVTDKRCPQFKMEYQDYSFSYINHQPIKDPGYDKGAPYVGQVYYGTDPNGTARGTTGHYPDLGREDVRIWWGQQYRYLFETGLEMVWQDMTTPCIGSDQNPKFYMKGDMGTFPFNLIITDNSIKGTDGAENEANNPCAAPPFIKILNLYSYNLHQATYDGLNDLDIRGNKRNFIIGRGCYSGMHKYAALWTGDNASNWDFMRITLHQILALGLSGQPITGSDVGGFEPDQDWQKWADPELLTRWTIMGAFLPWFRNHYNGKDGKKSFQEPYAFEKPEVLSKVPWDQQEMYRCVLPVCKHYIELRYRLLQLFYDAAFENIHTGRPICRPLFVTDDCDEALFTDKRDFLNKEFFVGDDLLVAPVLFKQDPSNGNGRLDVYLPACSRWYCFMDNKQPLSAAIKAGTVINYDAGIYNDPNHRGFIVPLFVREGAVIPTLELEQYVGQRMAEQQKPNLITLNIYPVKHGDPIQYEYNMYLDDGVSRSSVPTETSEDKLANNEFCHIQIRHSYTDTPNSRQIKIDKIHDQFHEKQKHFGNFFYVAVLHEPGEIQGDKTVLRMVNISGSDLPLISDGNPEERSRKLEESAQNAWYYNENINISFIKVFDTSTVGNPILINVKY